MKSISSNQENKFEIGQRIIPVGKTSQPFPKKIEDYVSSTNLATVQFLMKNGYLNVIDIIDKEHKNSYLLEINDGKTIYICGDYYDESIGADFFMEDDIIDWIDYEESL